MDRISYLNRIIGLNRAYLNQLRFLCAGIPVAGDCAFKAAINYKPPELLSFNVWLYNTLIFMLVAAGAIALSLTIDTTFSIIVVTFTFSVAFLWSMACVASWFYLRRRVNQFLSGIIFNSLWSLRKLHRHLVEELKLLNEQTKFWFLSVAPQDSQDLFTLTTIETSLSDVMKKLELIISDPTENNMYNALHLLHRPIQFFAAKLDRPVVLSLSEIDPFVHSKIQHLQKQVVLEQERIAHKDSA